MSNQIQPIKFKKIYEDPAENPNEISRRRATSTKRGKLEEDYADADEDERHIKRKISQYRQNFSLEHSYPAVIFDRISFSVDKSQQQSNFLEECIYRTGQSFHSLFGSHEQQQSDRTIKILKSVNLNVPYGSIFGLLGPSSCGKTTLLRCLVGLLEPTAGSIRLFGHQVNSCCQEDNAGSRNPIKRLFGGCCSKCAPTSARANKSKVPGTNVGYMPQDLGLYEDFTIRQILSMFGRYMCMDNQLIASRIQFMSEFLELPDIDRRIESLSGGQKRRVSFAIACLHMPPLIILDEPTVGVDPLLRQSIWKYLRRLADEENKTIIITTHYIEEAAQADQVALMRAGEILVQDTPAKIMQSNGSKTLEEAFLKICNNVQSSMSSEMGTKLGPQPKLNWTTAAKSDGAISTIGGHPAKLQQPQFADHILREGGGAAHTNQLSMSPDLVNGATDPSVMSATKLSLMMMMKNQRCASPTSRELDQVFHEERRHQRFNKSHGVVANHYDCNYGIATKQRKFKFMNRTKLKFNNTIDSGRSASELSLATSYDNHPNNPDDRDAIDERRDLQDHHRQARQQQRGRRPSSKNIVLYLRKNFRILCALLYKNYRRNVNSLPLLAFQFMLPIIQMVSFSLCVGGRPSDIGLGLVNNDQPIDFVGSATAAAADLFLFNNNNNSSMSGDELSAPPFVSDDDYFGTNTHNATTTATSETTTTTTTTLELLSLKYLNFIDNSMISIKPYDNLREAIEDVRRAKLWAVMEIGPNFTAAISRRFDLENFYQLELDTIHQSVIKLYPDRSNKILDMICQRSLINSYRKFLLNHFEHFKRLPIEVKEPIYDIQANIISNSIDGYTESIAPGLLASLTYIMAAGLTTFIMVVERGAGILERTYTSGINPIAYLIAHAIFRSFVMMLQIALVLILTFYVLKQPLVGSLGLAYLMLMTLNLTGITYGLLISSIVTDQNGAALTIVSSLVVKITLSGILWPLEAIPTWLRAVCYIQPLTMPIQALKSIILKGTTIGDRAVNLGFLVSISWLILFITISARRFKFYQH